MRIAFAPTTTCVYPPNGLTSGTSACSKVQRLTSYCGESTSVSASSSCNLNVAVCLAGSPRTFVQPHVLDSIRSRLIAALAAAHVDVFAVFNRKDNAAGRFLAHGVVDADETDVLRSLACLSPRALTLWEAHPNETRPGQKAVLLPDPDGAGSTADSTADSRNHKGCGAKSAHQKTAALDHPPGWDPNIYDAAIAQVASWTKCVELVEMEEQRRGGGFAYDLFVRARPDQFWFAPHPPACSFSSDQTYVRRNGVSDQNFVLPRAIAPAIFRSMLRQYERCPSAPLGWLEGGKPIDNLERWVLSTARPNATARGSTVLFHAAVVRAPPGEMQNSRPTKAPASRPPRGAGTNCYFSLRGTNISVPECMRQLYPQNVARRTA